MESVQSTQPSFPPSSPDTVSSDQKQRSVAGTNQSSKSTLASMDDSAPNAANRAPKSSGTSGEGVVAKIKAFLAKAGNFFLYIPRAIYEKISYVLRGCPTFFADARDNPEKFIARLANKPAQNWPIFFEQLFENPTKLFGGFSMGVKAFLRAYHNYKHAVACLPYLGNEQFLKMFKEQDAISQISHSYNRQKREDAQVQFNKKYANCMDEFRTFQTQAEEVVKHLAPMAMFAHLSKAIGAFAGSVEVRTLINTKNTDNKNLRRFDKRMEFLADQKEFREMVIKQVFIPFLATALGKTDPKFVFVRKVLTDFNDRFTKPENKAKADEWTRNFLWATAGFKELLVDLKKQLNLESNSSPTRMVSKEGPFVTDPPSLSPILGANTQSSSTTNQSAPPMTSKDDSKDSEWVDLLVGGLSSPDSKEMAPKASET